MPTAPSSTEPTGSGGWSEAGRAVRDVRHLLWFRRAAVRRRGVAHGLPLVLLLLATAAGTIPAWLPDRVRTGDRVLDTLTLLPTAMGGFLLLSIVSGIASGGGRELLSREHGVTFPVSPTTDHLGALLLAPLNVAWLLQAWGLLGTMAFANGPAGLWGAQLVTVLWILAATAAAQAIAWATEAVRRRPGGEWIVRGAMVALWGGAGLLFATGRITSFLDQLPTPRIVVGALSAGIGQWWTFGLTALALAVATPVLVAIGAWLAGLAARRTPRDELRIESGIRAARPLPRTELTALLRVDRASVWRVVPMRRGMTVLAVGPGIVAFAGNLQWAQVTILPGLVVSGAALLFGVNVWCLEGRGVLWRESLPVQPGDVWDARLIVLAEWLLLSSAITIAIAGLRAGVPSASELAAISATWLVVTFQVLSASMRWSAKNPFAIDLRSARATPAPPGTMVGYSARLALATTIVGLIFSGLARVDLWQVSVLVAIPFLVISSLRILASRRQWLDPVQRVRIVSAVAG